MKLSKAHFKKYRGLIVILIVAIIGSIVLLVARATGPTVGEEAESGSSPVACSNTSGASGGACVRFCPSSGCPANNGVLAVAAGDIAGYGANDQSIKTAGLIKNIRPSAVLILGDLAYVYNQDFQYDATKSPQPTPPGEPLCGGWHYSTTWLPQPGDAAAGITRWSDFRSISYPAPGNHEYLYEPNSPDDHKHPTYTCNRTSGKPLSNPAKPFYDYYAHSATGGPGGIPDAVANSDAGYYSYNEGTWHIIALNSECNPLASNPHGGPLGGCSKGSNEYTWLQNDLIANKSKSCIMAYMHRPPWFAGASAATGAALTDPDSAPPIRPSTNPADPNSISDNDGGEGLANYKFDPTNGLFVIPNSAQSNLMSLMALLSQYKADVVLDGHSHFYAHIKPVSIDPVTLKPKNNANGITEFIVGTGGAAMDGSAAAFSSSPNVIAHSSLGGPGVADHGILKMILKQSSMDYQFIGITTDITTRLNKGEPPANPDGTHTLTCNPKS